MHIAVRHYGLASVYSLFSIPYPVPVLAARQRAYSSFSGCSPSIQIDGTI
jgi:hypothetical protein